MMSVGKPVRFSSAWWGWGADPSSTAGCEPGTRRAAGHLGLALLLCHPSSDLRSVFPMVCNSCPGLPLHFLPVSISDRAICSGQQIPAMKATVHPSSLSLGCQSNCKFMKIEQPALANPFFDGSPTEQQQLRAGQGDGTLQEPFVLLQAQDSSRAMELTAEWLLIIHWWHNMQLLDSLM